VLPRFVDEFISLNFCPIVDLISVIEKVLDLKQNILKIKEGVCEEIDKLN
jgi:hypothetical protein